MDNIIDLAKDDDGVKNGNKRGSNDDRLINSSKSQKPTYHSIGASPSVEN